MKLFILIGYYKQVYKGEKHFDNEFIYEGKDNISGVNSGIMSCLNYGLKLTPKDYATLMIILSDNIVANKLVKGNQDQSEIRSEINGAKGIVIGKLA